MSDRIARALVVFAFASLAGYFLLALLYPKAGSFAPYFLGYVVGIVACLLTGHSYDDGSDDLA